VVRDCGASPIACDEDAGEGDYIAQLLYYILACYIFRVKYSCESRRRRRSHLSMVQNSLMLDDGTGIDGGLLIVDG
jgi:hypothetical protein